MHRVLAAIVFVASVFVVSPTAEATLHLHPSCHKGTPHGNHPCPPAPTVPTTPPGTPPTAPPGTTTLPSEPSSPPTPTAQIPPLTFRPIAVVGVGGELPTEEECVERVVSMTENRPENAERNATVGTSPNVENPRVTGNFVGTTDEILQWAACKWGMNPDWARAQAAVESNWSMDAVSDDEQSFGLFQVSARYQQTAFEDDNAKLSTAYNADYALSIWRRCFEGEYTWLNDVEHEETYAAGDGIGCMGFWFAGRFYSDPAVLYMDRVRSAYARQIWLRTDFNPSVPG